MTVWVVAHRTLAHAAASNGRLQAARRARHTGRMLTHLDLNADLGEGGACDADLLTLASSANIACGGHAGDADSMWRTVALALQHGVALGAHPSHPDREHFGRRVLDRALADVQADLTAQVQALRAVAQAQGGRLRHVKPHGALYNQAAADAALADAVAAGVRAVDPSLALMGLAGSAMAGAAQRHGLRFIPEAFADRGYRPDGRLQARTEPGALLAPPQALAQVQALVQHGRVPTVGGGWVAVHAQSLCVHGDGPDALALMSSLRSALRAWGVAVRATEAAEP